LFERSYSSQDWEVRSTTWIRSLMWASYYSPPHEGLLTYFLTYETLKKPPCSIAPSLLKVVLELVSYHRMGKVDVTCNSSSKMCKVNLNTKVCIVYIKLYVMLVKPLWNLRIWLQKLLIWMLTVCS
jgi:hypothetical protein